MMREVQILPTIWVIASGLIYWIPGELARRALWARNISINQSDYQASPTTAIFVAACAAMQFIGDHKDTAESLSILSASILIGNLALHHLPREKGILKSIADAHSKPLQECLNASLFISYLFIIWWAPSGITSIWEWPLQFQPSLKAIAICLIAAYISMRGWANRASPKLLKFYAFASCCLWQLGGAESKSVTIKEILRSEKITGYLAASKRFDSITELSSKFVESLGTLPFHANTHPAGKVAFFQLLDQLGAQEPTHAWSLFIALTTALCPLLVHKACRSIGLSLDRSALAALATALLPSFSLFSPGFDIFNATLSTLLLTVWIKSLTSTSLSSQVKWSLCTGLIGLTCLVYAYNLLTFGAVLIGYAYFITTTLKRCKPSHALKASLLAAATMLSAALLFKELTGYSAINSLIASINIQNSIEASNRQGLATTLLNGYDFSIGVGPYPFLVWATAMIPRFKKELQVRPSKKSRKKLPQPQDPIGNDWWKLSLITLASVLAISLSGYLDIETARVWIFLMPTVMIAIASNNRLNPTSLFPPLLMAQSIWGITMISRYQFFF